MDSTTTCYRWPTARSTRCASSTRYRACCGLTPCSPTAPNVATVTRTVSSANYSNFWRVLGTQPSDQAAPQFYSERWNVDAAGDVVGLWMGTDNASDVTIPSTLDEAAAGDLDRDGVLIPSYTLGLTPDTFALAAPLPLADPAHFTMGDTVPLVIQSGRLDVDTTVRVLGITYDINDDGDEAVSVVVGRPVTTQPSSRRATAADVDALARR